MALINPVHGLVVPLLCIFTLPLAIFAGITSTLAFSVLMFRMAVVYFDIALALVPQYLRGKNASSSGSNSAINSPFDGRHRQQRNHSRDGWKTPVSPPGSAGSCSGHSTPSPVAAFPQATGYLNSGLVSPHRRKGGCGFGSANLRRSRGSSSQVSLCSIGTITPIHEDEVSHDITPAAPLETGLAPSSGLDRDFEGIGGWRLDDRDNDSGWTNINSRLELPLERSTVARHTQRSQSVGPVSPSDSMYLAMGRSPSSRKESVSGEASIEDQERGERGVSVGSMIPASSGTKGAPEVPSLNTGWARLNQTPLMPLAFTALEAETNYFNNPDLLSPRSLRRGTP